jgi:hypothetical protein
MMPSLVINGQVGQTYRVDYVTHLQANQQWQTLTNITLTTTPFLLLDPSGLGQPKRFYRVVPVE